MGNKKIIGLYGVFSTGKSFLAHGLSSRLWDYDTVATDNILSIAREFDSDPYLQQSSYTAWNLIGEPTKENIIGGFIRYREGLQKYLRIIMDRADIQRVDMILEGIHLSPQSLESYKNRLEIHPILLVIPDKAMHWQRVEQKCLDRPHLLERIKPNFEYARILQNFLTEEASKFKISVIDNTGPRELVLENIWRTIND